MDRTPGRVFCLPLGVSSGCARPITGEVTEVTCPVIGRAQLELTPSKRRPWSCLYLISIKSNQLNRWINDQVKITLLFIILPIWLWNSVTCGKVKPSDMSYNFVTLVGGWGVGGWGLIPGSSWSSLMKVTWWRHHMETFSALLALCAGNSPVTGAIDGSILVRVMAWCQQATSHYLNQFWPSSMWPYGIDRPRVNSFTPSDTKMHEW